MSKKSFLAGTFLLTSTGILTRIMGFFYRIFLSHIIGAEGLGLLQLALPVQSLILAVTTTGMQMTITRLCASHMALGEARRSRALFAAGTFFSVGTTILLSFCLFRHSLFFASVILKDSQADTLLKLYAFSLPLSALHACIQGYWLARKKTGLPAFSQLLEQLVRISGTWLLFQILVSEGKPVTPAVAAGGSICGELAACLACLFALGLHLKTVHVLPCLTQMKRSENQTSRDTLYMQPQKQGPVWKYAYRKNHKNAGILQELSQTAVPLTLNRILLTLLGGMEMILIPQRLLLNGMTPSQSLSVYGIFTGMAMPLILFPCTATNSVSVMLVPSIAGYQALGQKNKIRKAVKLVCGSCFLMGCGCCVLFHFFGGFLGNSLFHSAEAGVFISALAFVCPFLYVHTTLTAILNGMGKSGECLIQNILGLSLRIAFVMAAIPVYGIRGYLYGILSSELFLTLLHLHSLKKLTGKLW